MNATQKEEKHPAVLWAKINARMATASPMKGIGDIALVSVTMRFDLSPRQINVPVGRFLARHEDNELAATFTP
ncbi:MAG: hypothetical protein ABL962_19355 [Fimbriimonadaceae bacterium]